MTFCDKCSPTGGVLVAGGARYEKALGGVMKNTNRCSYILFWHFLAVLLLCPCLSNAATISYNNEADFLGALSQPYMEGFESLPIDSTYRASVSTDILDVITTADSDGTSFLYLGNDGEGIFPTEGQNSLVAGCLGGCAFTLTFTLHNPVYAVGFYVTDFGEGEGTLSISTSAGDTLQIASSPPGKPNGNILFFGLINTDQNFNQFQLQKTSLNDGIGVDQIYLQSSPVPIPAAFWLFGSGLIGLFGFTRQGRRK